MNERIAAYLDGALDLEALPEDLRDEALMWEAALGELEPEGALDTPSRLESLVMDEVMRLPAHSPRPWLLRPRTVRFTPLSAGLLAAAALAGILLTRSSGSTGGTPNAAVAQEIFVQFTLEAPGARTVAVAGDFTSWEGQYALEDLDGDGVWTGRVPLRPGVHQYMFVIDGSDWVTDPHAERYADDGFGNRNAVLAVEGTSAELRS